MIHFRLKMQMLEDVVEMIPILHREDVALIHYQYFDRGQEVVIRLGVTLAPDRRVKT